MANRNEHLIVIMLEPVSFGVEFEVWPQHITIVPWFPCDDEDELDTLLSAIAAGHEKFELSAGPSETWGREDKYDVVTINDFTRQLHELHEDVFDSLEKNGFPIHQKDFLGQKYRPHVTLRNNVQKQESRLWPGQVVEVANFSLVAQVRLKKSGRMIKRLKKNYELT
ncbi:MAG TPA: 2'-5' RNA ligase family protein [Candidatus Saccharimonadales bacterium]|nr:2'-5' RNA ligase family protein [Candidatus Saccharimonadales bacterium]